LKVATGSFDLQMGFPLTNVVIAAADTLEAEDEGEGHSFPFTTLRAGDMVGIYVEPSEGLDMAIQVRQEDTLVEGLGFDPERGFDASIDVEEFVMLVEETGNYSFRILNSQDDFAGNTGDYEVVLFGTTRSHLRIGLWRCGRCSYQCRWPGGLRYQWSGW
jgi:hypothetical protein